MQSKFESISLSRRTVVRHIDSISDQLTEQLMIASNDFVYFSLALDETTDEEDTAQLLIFICGSNRSFVIMEELLGLKSIKIQSPVKTCSSMLCSVWKKITYPGTKLQALQQMEPKLSLEKMWAWSSLTS